ncbi:MAG: uracil-DNA glycosylase [Acidobacteriota bacterium]|nr:uracil-DNA glycosylase [Acidobacteriota bacterium]
MTAGKTPNTLDRRDFFKLGAVASAGAVLFTGEAEGYPEFRRRLRESDCQRCALAVGRRHIVVDRGNPDAAIIGIGEAPSFQEDARGIPFCGRPGQKLDELFAAEGLSTDKHLLLVHLVKCHPPGNRDPQPEEIARCRPFLERQLAFFPARFVALIGVTTLRHFAPERRPFSAHMGRFFRLPEWPGREFLALHHPAHLLRNPSLEPLMREHVRELAARVAT